MSECIRAECYWWMSGDFLDDVLEWFGENEPATVEFEEWLRKRPTPKGAAQ